MMWDAPWSFQAAWSDRSLFYTNYDADLRIMRRDLITGAQRTVFQTHGWVSSPANFCVHGSMAYVLASPSQSTSTYDLLAADTVSGTMHILKKLDSMLPTMMYGCSINADGTKFLIPTIQRNQSDINIATLN